MKKLLIIFEDAGQERFAPLNLLKPTYTLRHGMFQLWPNIKRNFPGYDLAFECAPQFASGLRRTTGLIVNDFSWASYEKVALVNGVARISERLAADIESSAPETAFIEDETLIAMTLDGQGSAFKDYLQIKHDLDKYGPFAGALKNRIDVSDARHKSIWDLMQANPSAIEADFAYAMSEFGASLSNNRATNIKGCHFISESDVYIHPEAIVLPGSVFDASSGPIYIDSGTLVESGTYVIGPLYAGVDCKLMGGKLSGSTLGPVCHVAGELEESVLQGFVNKHHAGFIGHSFVGEWVNFGAMTTNSDLKNNYSPVRVHSNGELVETGMTKVGSFIGDHTKFGIGTLLNTGIHIGAFCNIFGGELITEKHVPSFSWGRSGDWSAYNLDRALETAQKVMARRGRTLAEDEVTAIQLLHQLAED